MNAQTQHTPEPWTQTRTGFRGADGLPLIQGRTLAESQANQRLIAAAPELLALAERIARLNPDAGEIGEGTLHTIVEQARAAIAKSRGEA